MRQQQLTITALDGIPRVRPGDDLARLLIAALEQNGIAPRAQDILVVTQKIVSKAEGRYLELATVEPDARAREIAAITGKDVYLVAAILSQAVEVLRAAPNVLIVATAHGLVLANAGIDQSNLEAGDHGRRVLLLPRGSGPQRMAAQGAHRRAFRRGRRRSHLRQRRPRLAARHGRARHRCGRRPGAARPARREAIWRAARSR